MPLHRLRAAAIGTLALSALVTFAPVAARQGRGSPTPLELPAGRGFILGRVVRAGGGEVVPGAIVVLSYHGPVPAAGAGTQIATPPATVDPNRGSNSRSVVADARGRFLFRDLGGGRYAIAVQAQGYVAGGYLKKRPSGSQQFLDLRQDELRTNVEILVWKNGAVSGVVTDETGEPFVGVTVTALRRQVSSGVSRLTRYGTGTTDDRGVYRVDNLPPGTYVVGLLNESATMPVAVADYLTAAVVAGDTATTSTLRANGINLPIATGVHLGGSILQPSLGAGMTMPPPGPDGSLRVYATTFHAGSRSIGQATPIVLGAGEERRSVNFAVHPVRAVRVSGILRGPDGPGAQLGVRLMPAGFEVYTLENGSEAASTATDAAGRFTFLGVASGEYVLRSSSAGAGGRGGPAANAAGALSASQPVSVGTTDIEDLDVRLEPGFTFSGRVVFSGARAQPSPQELARLTIAASAIGPQPVSSPLRGRVTGDGTFQTSGYAPGRYVLNASIMAGWTLRSITAGGRDVSVEPTELGGDVTGLVVTFTDAPAELAGTIVNAQGAPHAASEVLVFPADSDTWMQGYFSSRRVRLTPGASSGTYAVTGLPPGDYFVAALDSGDTEEWQDAAFLERVRRSAIRVTLRDGEKTTQALRVVALR